MDFDVINLGVNGSPIATGNPNPDQDHGKTNTKNTSENRHGGSITLLRSLDLADRIKGYRLLELISEKASNGLRELFMILSLRT